MNCRTIRRKDIIEDYLAHRLGEALADEFETHLLGCSRCSTLLEYMQSLRDGLEERASSIRTAISRGADIQPPDLETKIAILQKKAEKSRESDLLKGWDAIASYLHCDARFLLRWARNLALPVYELEKERMDSVYAYKSGIDAWLRQQGFDPDKDELDAWLSQRGFEVARLDVRLNGWLEIAGFLCCSPPQVQSWEKSLGFPVHRRLSGKQDLVYAFESEIDAWLMHQGFDRKEPLLLEAMQRGGLDDWLRRRSEILSKGPADASHANSLVNKGPDTLDAADAAFRFPQEQATTEEKTKKPSKQ